MSAPVVLNDIKGTLKRSIDETQPGCTVYKKCITK